MGIGPYECQALYEAWHSCFPPWPPYEGGCRRSGWGVQMSGDTWMISGEVSLKNDPPPASRTHRVRKGSFHQSDTLGVLSDSFRLLL